MRARQLFAGLAMPLPLIAQPSAPLTPPFGSHVRLDALSIIGRRATGPLREMNQGFVTIGLDARSSPSSITVPWEHITDIRVGHGKETRRGIATGAIVGLFAAGVIYPAVTSGGKASDAALIFGILPLTGSVIGWWQAPERWSSLGWRPTIDTVMADGHMARLRLAPEMRVRVRANSHWFSARILETTDDSLVVRKGSERQAYPWGSVLQVNMRRGRNRTRGAALGLTLAGVGMAGTFLVAKERERGAAGAIPLVLASGAAAGALVGMPGWTRIPVPLR